MLMTEGSWGRENYSTALRRRPWCVYRRTGFHVHKFLVSSSAALRVGPISTELRCQLILIHSVDTVCTMKERPWILFHLWGAATGWSLLCVPQQWPARLYGWYTSGISPWFYKKMHFPTWPRYRFLQDDNIVYTSYEWDWKTFNIKLRRQNKQGTCASWNQF